MSTSQEFLLPLGELDAGGRAYRFAITVPWLRAALEDTDVKAGGEGGTLNIRASKSGTDVIVHGELHAEVEAACARCLGPALVRIDEKVSYLFAPAPSGPGATSGGSGSGAGGKGAATKKGVEAKRAADKADAKSRSKKDDDDDDLTFEDEDADIIHYTGENVVLDGAIRDEILLAVPMIPLCSESCPGIAPTPKMETGSSSDDESPIDPRLAPLLRLMSLSKANKE